MVDSSKKETNGLAKSKDNAPDYGRVVLTLKNCVLSQDKLSPTPSAVDGLDAETEADLRILGCELIQTGGILLRLPQVAMATAQVLFQRFYYSKSFVRQNCEITGMACLLLASKIEEAPRRVRDIINVYHHIKQVNNQKTIAPMLLDQTYLTLKFQVIKAERRVLKELGFCVHVQHPHKLIMVYLEAFGMVNKQYLLQLAWNYMNDALRTDVFVRYQPETVACACIHLTARKLKIPMPKSPHWFKVFDVNEDDIQNVSLTILRLHSRGKPNAEELEKKVQELCKKFEETRLRNKPGFNNVTSGNNTPNSPVPAEKRQSPKRNHSDQSRSRTPSDSPKHKRYKRSRSRSRSYDKYKKSRSRRSRSVSPSKIRRYRSRSRSNERIYHKEGKYVADYYKEDKYYKDDKYYKEERRDYRRDDDRYKRDDDKTRKDDDYRSRRDDDKYRKEDDKIRKDDERYRREDDKVRKDDDKYRRDDEKIKKDDEKYRKEEDVRNKKDDMKHRKDDEARIKKDDEKKRTEEYEKRIEYAKLEAAKPKEDKRKKEEDGHKHKKDKKDEDGKKVKSKHSSSKHKSSGEKKKRKKHYDEVFEESDECEIIHVKKEKKSR